MKAAKKSAQKTANKSEQKPAKKTVNKKPTPKVTIDPDRAEAAADVLLAVYLHEKHFDLESELVLKDGRPVVDEDTEGHLWVTVKLHVPALDVDCWLDGTHLDHPDNQRDDEDSA